MPRTDPWIGAGATCLILAMAIGPWLSDPDYSWVHHTTSQLAGQNMPGAWIMRTGFIGFGAGIALASLRHWRAGPVPRSATAIFGLSMIGAGLFPHARIHAVMGVDARADTIHSAFAGAAGAAFAVACASRLVWRRPDVAVALSWAGLAISVTIPLAMVAVPAFQGVLQRGMFLFSVVWFWHEFSCAQVHKRRA